MQAACVNRNRETNGFRYDTYTPPRVAQHPLAPLACGYSLSNASSELVYILKQGWRIGDAGMLGVIVLSGWACRCCRALPNLSSLPPVMGHGQLGIGLAAAMAYGPDPLERWIELVVFWARPLMRAEVRSVERAATSYLLAVCAAHR